MKSKKTKKLTLKKETLTALKLAEVKGGGEGRTALCCSFNIKCPCT